MRSFALLLTLVVLFRTSYATLWSQCGGQGYSGPTSCAEEVCCSWSQYYHQCVLQCPIQGSSSTTRVSVTSSITTTQRTTVVVATTRSSITTSSRSVTAPSPSHLPSTKSSSAAVAAFTNPVVYSDYPDNDVAVGPDGLYYLSASNFHYSPGAPILRSADLQHWEAVSHSIPTLDFGDNYSLINNTQAYRRGTWASSLRYRKSDDTWYWIGCIDFWNSFVYSSKSITGPWERKAAFYATCFYDCGLFFDDDQSVYVVHSSNKVNVTQLSSDLTSIVKTQQIAENPAGFEGMEGNRLYKVNGTYYILNDSGSGSVTWIWRSSSVFGPWTSRVLQLNSRGPLIEGGGMPNQGSLVLTPLGDWHFISFTWAFPLGRIPVIAPITWGADGWPILGLGSNNTWPLTYPNRLLQVPTPSWTGSDYFRTSQLNPRWEWNHNPDKSKYVVGNGVTLFTATNTTDLFLAKNTLTHRWVGLHPVGTITLDFNNLADGDRAGLAAFKDNNHCIGIARAGSSYNIYVRTNMTLSYYDWSTTNIGTDVATIPVPKGSGKVWFRGKADPLGAKMVAFEYSLDGNVYKQLGGIYKLDDGFQLFMGYRWGIFNYATKALGGSVKLLEFNQI